MKEKKNETPANYLQPIRQFLTRTVIGNNEDVDFVPQTNMRIWYNNQVEGYPLHKHDAIEIVIPMENGYKYTANGRKFDLNMGDILFIPPGILHEIECDCEGSRFIYLFNIDFISKFFDYRDLEEFLKEARLVNPTTYPEIYSQIFDHFMNINDLYFLYDNIVLEMSIYSHLLAIFGALARYSVKSEPICIIDTKQRETYIKFKSLINYINTHYMDDITLDYAASFVGFSKFHFSRLFKEYTDSTFYDYLSRRRIQAAKSLLGDDDLSITDIAFQTGFNNLTTFCRSFQKIVACSPSAYRNKLKRKNQISNAS